VYIYIFVHLFLVGSMVLIHLCFNILIMISCRPRWQRVASCMSKVKNAYACFKLVMITLIGYDRNLKAHARCTQHLSAKDQNVPTYLFKTFAPSNWLFFFPRLILPPFFATVCDPASWFAVPLLVSSSSFFSIVGNSPFSIIVFSLCGAIVHFFFFLFFFFFFSTSPLSR